MKKSITVYCASSSRIDEKYYKAADDLGRRIAERGMNLVFGGGARGAMGRLADAALAAGGSVTGIMPEFMVELEWAHPGCSELIITTSMHERKAKLIENVDAVVALPGGSGTLEELIETITLKRLGQFLQPIVLVNMDGFYDPLVEQYNRCIDENFMDQRHHDMWSVVSTTAEVFDAIDNAAVWSRDAHNFAAL
jgi:uncharacterized protein (TIGR00730 family)